MRKPVTVAISSVLVLASCPAPAAVQSGPNASSVARGRCYNLILNGRDLTAICRNKITTLSAADGSVAFLFSARNVTIGFAGDESGVLRGEEGPWMAVRFVLAGEQGDLLEVVPASGACKVGDLYAGPAVIECAAQSVFGTMKASFVSNGRRPVPG